VPASRKSRKGRESNYSTGHHKNAAVKAGSIRWSSSWRLVPAILSAGLVYYNAKMSRDVFSPIVRDIQALTQAAIVGEWNEGSGDRSSEYEYIMWSNDEAYFNECRARMLFNETWAKPLGPLVEKVEAKEFARAWSPSVSIVPTYAFYDESNITDLTLDVMTGNSSLSQPYVIKSGHRSGGVAVVQNNTYRCFKGCGRSVGELVVGKRGFGKYATPIPLDDEVSSRALKLLQEELNRTYGIRQGEFQYRDIPHRIIVEEALPMERTMDVTHWYVANGIPILAGMECTSLTAIHQEDRKRNIYSPNFVELPVEIRAPRCAGFPVKKPKTWELMYEVAKELGSHLHGYVVRIDLYASDDRVYFSEFTFASGECKPTMNFHPRVTDGLMYAVLHGQIPASVVTPEFVERTIMNRSWVLIVRSNGGNRFRYMANSFPSPVDLCESDGSEDVLFNSTSLKDRCYAAARKVKSFPLRCFLLTTNSASSNDGNTGRTVRSIGAYTYDKEDRHENSLKCMEALSIYLEQ